MTTEPTSFKNKQGINIFYVPSFGDTNGAQTGVKKAIILKNLINDSPSFKIVYLIKYQTTDNQSVAAGVFKHLQNFFKRFENDSLYLSTLLHTVSLWLISRESKRNLKRYQILAKQRRTICVVY